MGLAAVSASGSDAAETPFVRPWTPPASDSVEVWAAEARTRFRAQTADSVTGANYRPYELGGVIARRMLRSLGPANLHQAMVIDAALDSLGFDAEVTIDPTLPRFALVMVRNPHRPGAPALGFLYWYRGDDIRLQGMVFRGGRAPKMRAWWTSRSEAPYECAIVDRNLDGALSLSLLRMGADGGHWNVIQYAGHGPDLSGASEAVWSDVNRDGRPELVAWGKGADDSMFVRCPGCPGIITERTFVERDSGFALHDAHILPSAYATFVSFVRQLLDRNRAAAARLLAQPAKVDEAIALGWGARREPGTWTVDYAEPEEAWPTWLALRFHGARGDRRYVVHFMMREGRWIIRDWVPVESRKSPASRVEVGK